MGVAYIHKETPNPTRKFKSLYFVVIDEIMMPNPNPNPAKSRIRYGNASIHNVKWISEPAKEKYDLNTKNIENWIPNVTRYEITRDIGETSLGKYTLLKILEFRMNVFEVQVRHFEK
jgi:hypothetical protein